MSKAPKERMVKYTVFCKQANDRGTTWVDTIEVPLITLMGIPQDDVVTTIQNLAVQACAKEWGWDDLDEISCFCVLSGDVYVMHFEDLSE